jgi:hypothetical protein
MWSTLTGGGGGGGVSRQVRPYILIGLHTLTLTHNRIRSYTAYIVW